MHHRRHRHEHGPDCSRWPLSHPMTEYDRESERLLKRLFRVGRRKKTSTASEQVRNRMKP